MRMNLHGIALIAGLRYVRREPLIISLLVATYIGLFLVGPLLQVLLPEYSRSRLNLGEAERGSLMTVLGVGLLAGGGLAQFLPTPWRGRAIILGATAMPAHADSAF
ncbi:MAG: hypothetical protein U1F16_02135 [Turneriella sp.]